MWSDETTPVQQVKDALRAFNHARDWEQFHRPKDLAMCISAEAGELLECFLWKAEGDPIDMDRVREELADVLITAINLANTLGIDAMAAVEAKIHLNGTRYPVSKAVGRADKYDSLDVEPSKA